MHVQIVCVFPLSLSIQKLEMYVRAAIQHECNTFTTHEYECNCCWYCCYCCWHGFCSAFYSLSHRRCSSLCVWKTIKRERKRTHFVLPMVFSYFQICHILISINLSMEWRNGICQCRHVSNLIFSAFGMWFVQNVNFARFSICANVFPLGVYMSVCVLCVSEDLLWFHDGSVCICRFATMNTWARKHMNRKRIDYYAKHKRVYSSCYCNY